MPYNPPSSPLNYPANSGDAARIFKYDRAPTSSDFANFKIRDFWIDSAADHLYFLVDKTGSSATWIRLGGTAGQAETLTGNTGGAVNPDSDNNINVVGTSPLTVTGDPATNTLTITTSGTVADTYTADSGSATPASDNLNILGGTGVSTTGSGSTITIDTSGDVANSYVTDSGTATPAANILNVVGGSNINTSGATDTVTVNLDNDITVDSVTTPAINSGASNDLTVTLGDAAGSNSEIIQNTTPATLRKLLSSGAQTLPLQPAFWATLESIDADVTGDGTTYTVGTNTAWTIIDQQGNAFNTNGIFTVPVDGWYFFTATISVIAFGTMNNLRTRIVTGNINAFGWTLNPNPINASINNGVRHSLTAFGYLTASQTVFVTVEGTGAGADSADIYGDNTGGGSMFTGALLF